MLLSKCTSTSSAIKLIVENMSGCFHKILLVSLLIAVATATNTAETNSCEGRSTSQECFLMDTCEWDNDSSTCYSTQITSRRQLSSYPSYVTVSVDIKVGSSAWDESTGTFYAKICNDYRCKSEESFTPRWLGGTETVDFRFKNDGFVANEVVIRTRSTNGACFTKVTYQGESYYDDFCVDYPSESSHTVRLSSSIDCKCDNGYAGSSCTRYEETKCTSCYSGYRQINGKCERMAVKIKVDSGAFSESTGDFYAKVCDKGTKCTSAKEFTPRWLGKTYDFTFDYPSDTKWTPTEVVISTSSTNGACFASVTYNGEEFSLSHNKGGCLSVDSPAEASRTVILSKKQCTCENGAPSYKCTKHGAEQCDRCNTGYRLKNQKCVDLKVAIKVDNGAFHESTGDFFAKLCDDSNKCTSSVEFTPRWLGGTEDLVLKYPSGSTSWNPTKMIVSTESTNGACFSSVTYNGEEFTYDHREKGCVMVDAPEESSKTFSFTEYECTCANGTPSKECFKNGVEKCGKCDTGYKLTHLNKCVDMKVAIKVDSGALSESTGDFYAKLCDQNGKCTATSDKFTPRWLGGTIDLSFKYPSGTYPKTPWTPTELVISTESTNGACFSSVTVMHEEYSLESHPNGCVSVDSPDEASRTIILSKKQCTCENGSPSYKCTKNGAEMCGKCNSGYRLIKDKCVDLAVAIKVDSGASSESTGDFHAKLCDKNNKCTAAEKFTPRWLGGTVDLKLKYPSDTKWTPNALVISTESTNGACFSSVTLNGEEFTLEHRHSDGCLWVDSPDQASETVRLVQLECKCENGSPSDKCTKRGAEMCGKCNDGYRLSKDNKCQDLKVQVKVDSSALSESTGDFYCKLCDRNGKCTKAAEFTPRWLGGTVDLTLKYPSGTWTPTELVISTESTNGACFSSVTYNGKEISLEKRSGGCLSVDSPDEASQIVPLAAVQCTCDNGTVSNDCTKNGVELCGKCNDGFHLENNKCVANTCTCNNGSPVAADKCTTDKAENCASCSNGFALTGSRLTGKKCVMIPDDIPVVDPVKTPVDIPNETPIFTTPTRPDTPVVETPVETPIVETPTGLNPFDFESDAAPEATETEEEGSDDLMSKIKSIPMMYLGAGAGALVLIIIIACCCCCKKEETVLIKQVGYGHQPRMVQMGEMRL